MLPYPDIDPVAIALGPIKIHWYGLTYIAGLAFAWWLARRRSQRPQSPLKPDQVDDLIFYAAIGVVLGGRFGYVFFYGFERLLSDPMWLFRVWEGGMAFHGGLIGVAVAGYIFCKMGRIPPLQVADAMAMLVAVGLGLGRLANFINAELWGRETTLPWGVIFPGEDAQTCVQAAAGLCARHPSQLYEALGEGLILGALLLYLLFRTGALRRSGLLTGIFLIGYGLTRFMVEWVRQPDAQFQTMDNPIGYAVQLSPTGLTMGQILTLPMLMAGLWLIQKARARP